MLTTNHFKLQQVLFTSVAHRDLDSITTLTILTTMLQNVRCIPASDVSASEAAFQGVTVSSLAEHPTVTHSATLASHPLHKGLHMA